MNTRNLLLGLFIIAVFAVGLTIGHFTLAPNVTSQSNQTPPMNSTETQGNKEGSTTVQASGNGFASIIAGMTADQKKALNALGIDVNAITPAMVTCVESSLGTSRIEEIKNGASLSFTEKLKLVACYE